MSSLATTMQALDLVGYTADLTHLVLSDPITRIRYRVPVSSELVSTLVEVLEVTDDHVRLDLLRELAVTTPAAPEALDVDAASPAAALLQLGRVATGQPRPKVDGSESRLTPSEIQRMLRAGKSPESVAEQAGTSLDWVLRWYQPIAAEQGKVIMSVRGGRQEREGFGKSDHLIGDAVRSNLLDRDIDPDEGPVQWSAARPDGRPYWTVTLRFTEGDRPRRATWRYDIGTGQVTPRDDLAVDLGWTRPVTHPTPGRLHLSSPAGEEDPSGPVRRAAPPPPPTRAPARWAPPAPPASPRTR